jgi:N-methylhydantoinase A
MLTIGIDIGGTFTDLVARDDSGRDVFVKSPSTPQDQSIGVMVGLELLAQRLELDRATMLAKTQRIVHGTTVATNALLERKGAKVALLTTMGHRDVLEMREGLKDDRYNLRSTPPEALVPRQRRLGIRERIRPDGSVLLPLDDASLDAAIAAIRASDVDAVAVCYLHAYRNPAHEIATVERIRRELPGLYVSRSSDILPQIKEYERVSTTVVNAYVGPAVQRYLTGLKRRLGEAGFTGGLFIVLSHGGIAPVEEAARLAAGTVLSGPAGGVSGGLRCAEMLDLTNLICFDMGGTSSDISLIADGRATLSADGNLADQRIALRSLDITSIAAGGGSIASVDSGGRFGVGPQSAGSVPGPACYGQGGEAATVTDANIVLGYLDAAAFLGGERQLDRAAAEVAIDNVAAKLRLSRIEAAAGVYRLVNIKMADGIRLTTLRRGVDPRRFTLLSFGGAAGLHAVEVARELELARIVVPTVASVLSAWGMLASNLRYEVSRTHLQANSAADGGDIRQLFSELGAEATDRLRGWFDGLVRIERSAEMRYGEQIFEIDVPLDHIDWQTGDTVAQIEDAFHRRHEEVYTYASRDQEVVFVNARVAAVGEVQQLSQRELAQVAEPPPPVPRGKRQAFFGALIDVPVYALEQLQAGQAISGPAIIEAETTTVVINVGDRLTVNCFGWLDIQLGQRTGGR